jgi:hypothetical protein
MLRKRLKQRAFLAYHRRSAAAQFRQRGAEYQTLISGVIFITQLCDE